MLNDTIIHDFGTMVPAWVLEMSLWTYGSLAFAVLFLVDWYNSSKVRAVVYLVCTNN